MKSVVFTWPDGKQGALTTSWDDGTIHDRRLVSILNRYGIKGTWNLCSSLLGQDKNQTGWMDIVNAEEVSQLYAGHEVACHTVHHMDLTYIAEDVIRSELITDRQRLEGIVKAPVKGLAYPFGSVDKRVRDIVQNCGIVYARGVNETHAFQHPEDFLDWSPTCHFDNNYRELWEGFLNPLWDGKLLFLMGHSFEFEPDHWDHIEDFCKLAGNHPQVWYATNMEMYEYISAWRMMSFSIDLSIAKNNSCREVWLRIENSLERIRPGEVREI
ncbi:MAG: polysaccharide deacetylase family protein [Chloroflexi bacterium]|nr:polysaccharide deacetylase family protein [Chloroflexota bacterium]